MNGLDAIILGIVEGVTEFLPISSTGHLIVVAKWLGLGQTDVTKAFEVIIQLAAILAVVASYGNRFTPRHMELWMKVALAFIPVGAVGFLFYHQIKALFSEQLTAVMFILGGIVFLMLEYFYKDDSAHVNDVENVTWMQALWIGIAQVFALIPGTSRAGATIVGALLVGLDRRAAAEFSFLLALPVMLAASGLDFLKHYHEFAGSNGIHLALGFVTSFVVAFFTMHLFLRFLKTHTFIGFGFYRIAFGIVLIWLYGF